MRRLMPLITVLIIGAIAVSVGLAIGQAKPEATTPRTGTAVYTTATLAVPTTGTRDVLLGGHHWRLTISGVTYHHSIAGSVWSARAQGVFVLVYMSAQNLDRSPQSLLIDASFAVRDSQGRTFTVSTDGTNAATDAAHRAWAITPIQPTFRASLVYAFDVAPDARHLVLIDEPLFDKAFALWRLGT